MAPCCLDLSAQEDKIVILVTVAIETTSFGKKSYLATYCNIKIKRLNKQIQYIKRTDQYKQ